MQTQSKNTVSAFDGYARQEPGVNAFDYMLNTAFEKIDGFKSFFQHNLPFSLEDILSRLTVPVSKKSFLVFKHNKYSIVPTGNIAFFYVKYEASMIRCFDRQEYPVNYSLEQVQHLLSDQQFFRLNRQYLINFSAVKEVEHYFGRKLLVKLAVPFSEKLLVSKEKAAIFLEWLENR